MSFGFGTMSPQTYYDPMTGLPVGGDPATSQAPGPSLSDLLQRAYQAVPSPASVAQGVMSGASRDGQAMANSVWNAATLPRDVMQGAADIRTEEGLGRAVDLAGMAMTGGLGGVARQAGETALGSGPIFSREALYETPNVPQFALPRFEPPQGVSQRVQDLVSNTAVRDKMAQKIEQGIDMKGPEWYNLDPMRQAFVKELGERGNTAFQKYLDIAAATSPQSKVPENVRNASYYYTQMMRGDPIPPVGERNPSPYGHFAANTHKKILSEILETGWNPILKPKTASFTQNLGGNWTPGTIDTHATRLPAMLSEDPRFLATSWRPDNAPKGTPSRNIQAEVTSGKMSMDDALKEPGYWLARPNPNEYGALEKYYQDIGREYGMQAAPTQASAWVGGGKLTGLGSDESLPFIGFVEDRIKLTAEKRGMDPQDVLKRFIRGEMPLLSVGGAAAGGTAAAAMSQADWDAQARREGRPSL